MSIAYLHIRQLVQTLITLDLWGNGLGAEETRFLADALKINQVSLAIQPNNRLSRRSLLCSDTEHFEFKWQPDRYCRGELLG